MTSAPAGASAAPRAPGRLGEAIGAEQLLSYQSELADWLTQRRTELGRLDAAAQKAANSQAFTGDVVLAMSMWQSVSTGAEQLRELWDSGRADAVARERMSRVIWGRLDGAQVPGGGADPSAQVSLVESTRLCDALISQLRVRLSFDPNQADTVARLRSVRASLVRSGDLVRREDLAGDGVPDVDALVTRLDRVQADAARGADASGPLAELEAAAARAERDTIVAAAQRHEQDRDHSRATSLLERLAARADVLADLAARCRREVLRPPNLAVPDVSRLGDVPDQRDALAAYLTRLELVARAMDAVEDAYTTPLRTRASLRFRLTSATERARRNGRADSPTVAAAQRETREAVETTPCDVELAVDLVDLYERLTQQLPSRAGASGTTEAPA
ncbi:hypothetical protein [Litorihabitans aurantiacus]|uniref:Uncharacterized protein n=1 Tax=Litorihabitans aurantiacus TaxID=1930061 RepID=A0AA37URC9_9MICO|nr:hypothetical protein [Litorihabitans aurantiacus]GMA30200.1 hypothetical protein GCM10025875_01920 [Litorihabitans aurantiacus]